MNIYAASIVAFASGGRAGGRAVALLAINEEEAVGKALKAARGEFPVPEWSNHSVSVVVVPADWIRAIASPKERP